MKLTTKQKQFLKAKAHPLKPIIFIGHNGFTDNVKNEIDRGLEDHALIKISIQKVDRDLKKQLFLEICQSVGAHAIQLVGKTGVIYRKSNKVTFISDSLK